MEPERRTTASSLANLSFNVLGYLPAPLIYTQIKNAYSDEVKGNQVAMAVILYSNAASFLFLCLALCVKRKKVVEDVDGVDLMNPSSGLRDTMSENTGGDLPMSLKNLSKDEGSSGKMFDRRNTENRVSKSLESNTRLAKGTKGSLDTENDSKKKLSMIQEEVEE